MDIDETETEDILPIREQEEHEEQTASETGHEGRSNDFYLKYYSGHEGKFGHEFLEFEVQLNDDGNSATIIYTNNTNYRREARIKKRFTVSALVVSQIKKLVEQSEITRESDTKWPPKNRDGKQELVIRNGETNVKLVTTKIGSLTDVKKSEDPDGLRAFYYFVQDVKALVFSLINLHFKLKPI